MKEEMLDAEPLAVLIRKELDDGRTQKELAAILGVSSSWVSGMYHGEFSTVELSRADLVLTKLGEPLEIFYPYEGDDGDED